jgi:hypothetical protein
MPPGSRSDDKFFGGQKGAAGKAWESMRRNYTAKDAEHVYYGSIAKRKRRGRTTAGSKARKWLGL